MSRREMALGRLAALSESLKATAFRHHSRRDRFRAIVSRPPVSDRVVVSDNLFPTPPEIAWRMAELLEVGYGMHVLEPSCGTGRLLEALAPKVEPFRLTVDVCDIEPRLVAHCLKTHQWAQGRSGDFMEYQSSYAFDRIVMNPPFRRGTDAKHILRARSMLAPGGRLVALCYNGSVQNKLLKPQADMWWELPQNSFQSEGTGAGVCMLTMASQ